MIETNEYVRTKKGIIGELISETLSYPEPSEWKLKVNNTEIVIVESEDYPVNHSKQLIDLIEVGDIVNSCIVVGFGYECVNGNKEKSILVEGKYTKVNFALLNWDIKTILTKEQFETNCYKVGGKQWD